MEVKKTQFIVIAGLTIFWIILIGWGMIKTNLKLLQEKYSAFRVSKVESKKESKQENKPSVSAKQKETKEAVPAAVPTEAAPILVRVFKVKPTDFSDSLPVMGSIKGKTEIELRFEINGVIKKIYFREGEKVKKDSLIASLDPKDALLKVNYAKSKFNSARAAYNSVQKKLEVHQKLYEAGALIKSKIEEVELECESAKFQIETAKSEWQLAENELDKTNLYANKDGVMGPRDKEEGEFVTPQDKLGSLLETNEIFVEVGIVERDIEKIKLGQKAKVYVDAYPNANFEGTIDSIFPVVEGKSRTLTVKIKVPNPDGLLLPGMFSRAEINIIELKNALIIPATSLISSGTGTTLVPAIPAQSLQVSKEEVQTGIVQLRSVKLGYITSDYAQVIEGLNAEDLVVIETQGELKDNAKVKIIGVEETSF
jgi:RND family efflux transporter MFP subunit